MLMVVFLSITGCTGTTIIRTSPPEAGVMINGSPLKGNSFDYGRWVGNDYKIVVSANGYKTKETVADVHLGTRAGLVAFYSIVSIVGIPNLFALPWYGQLDDEIYIALEKEPPPRPVMDLPGRSD